jgi:polyhydroxyalkanoate synthesis repressor PhaR
MPDKKPPTTIKKYANRRLYHMGTSTYVTLEDLARMVRGGEDFVVTDAKSGEDITRAVLGQIIFEQENKQSEGLLPTTFLRQLIRFYGDSMQGLVPRYLEFSMDSLIKDQSKLRAQMEKAFGPTTFHAMEEQARVNMAFFSEAFKMWTPFRADKLVAAATEPATPRSEADDLADLKKQMADMSAKLEALGRDRASGDK